MEVAAKTTTASAKWTVNVYTAGDLQRMRLN